jgi:hypothetical protein
MSVISESLITPCQGNLPALLVVPDAASPRVIGVNPFLHTALVDIESHVASSGWDQPTRLYALVETAVLLREEPSLMEEFKSLGIERPPAFTPVEQEDLPDMPLDEILQQITWGEQVTGCAIAVERLVLPAEVEVEIPHDSPEMPAYVAAHPLREEIRLVAAVLRNGHRDCALRMRSNDKDEEVLFGEDLAPGLLEALLETFTEYEYEAVDESELTDEERAEVAKQRAEQAEHEHGPGCNHDDDHGHGH